MKRLLRVLNSSGDSRVEYDLEDSTSLANAKRVFDEAVKKGSSVFNVKPGSNDAAKRVSTFDEVSQEAVVIPKIVGG